MNQVYLDEVIRGLEEAFGEELPFSEQSLDPQDVKTLERVFGDSGYQAYLQDQVNRQIIREYLTNAVALGFLSEQRLRSLAHVAGTIEGRALLSLHMLMSSVEQANDLPLGPGPDSLKPLSPTAEPRPPVKLVRR